MTADSTKNTWRRLAAFALGGIVALTLAACGGGGGSPGSGGNTGTSSGSIAVSLTNSAGVASNTLSGSDTLTVVAQVKNGSGGVAKNEVVTFTVSNNLAKISPTSATALTDANGVAKVSLKSAGNGTGAATVTATATVTGATSAVTGSANFAIGAATAATPVAVNFISAVPSDKSIVIKGAGGNGRTEVALLTFQVVDNTNNGIPGVTLNFTTQSSAAVTLVSTTGTTDADGKVTVSLNSGSQPTTVRVIATVAGTSISTLSDTVTVTTGQPVQQAFSLSMKTHNPEGWNIDNTQVEVLALLADANGQAVADGTQVVFTTTAGAIFGSNGDAQCLTANGACTVTWRSQNPRPASGVGTITATATSGTTNLSTSQSFYMSGSSGNVANKDTGALYNQVNPVTGVVVNPLTMDFTTNCNMQTLSVRVVDVNSNPMPKGTSVGVSNAVDVSASVVNNNVVDIAPPYLGSIHTFTVTPAGCDIAGTNATATFYIDVGSPSGLHTLNQVTIYYKKS
ncbi:MAG: hypothetical protein H6R04_1552 [Burkholderiaceae bacterium]|nr:hypothetical protein [Burkholderiaceae bacterium]